MNSRADDSFALSYFFGPGVAAGGNDGTIVAVAGERTGVLNVEGGEDSGGGRELIANQTNAASSIRPIFRRQPDF